MNNSYYIYLLYNTANNKTYIGITNNRERRIRQHNGDLSGGARYTKNNKENGEWNYFGFIEGDGDCVINKNLALSIEKKIKLRSRKFKLSPIERRLKAIELILDQNPNLKFTLN